MFFLADLTLDTMFHYINTGGIVGVLGLIIVGGSRRWWVFGWQYHDLEERQKRIEDSNTMWMQLALRGSNVTMEMAKKISEDSDDK